MKAMLFPSVHELQANDEDEFVESLVHASDMTVAQALAHLGLTEVPESRRQLYMATYGRMKEAETSTDENFPTRGELREAREILKGALDGLGS